MPVLHAGGDLGEDRALRDRGAVQARGPQGLADGAGDDPRGGGHLPRRARGPLLPRPAADALPHPDQGARRAAAAGRGAAHARVHDEGRLLLRPRRGGAGALLRAAGRRLRAHPRPLRAALVQGRVRRRDDGRLRRRRVHGALPGGRERGGAGARLRRQRRGRLGRARSRSSCRRRWTRRSASTRPAWPRSRRSPTELGLPHGAFIKALPVDRRGPRHGPRPAARRPPPQRDQAAQRARRRLPPGQRRGDRGRSSARSATSARSAASVPIIKDAAIDRRLLRLRRQQGRHPPARRRSPARDFESYEIDVRTVEAGDTAPGGGTIEIEPAIEVGNIFKLGTRYSEPLGATYLDEDGVEQPIVMGCYGIGPGADHRRRDRAARRRARDRLARGARPLAGPPRLAGQGRRARARGRRQALRGAARPPGPRSSTTTATPGRGRS